MSYILDALRRLEQDKERTRRGANPVEAVTVPDFEEAETRDRRRFWWVGIGVLLLAVVSGATYWITRQTLVSLTDQAREESSPRLSSAAPGEDRPGPSSFPEEFSSASRQRPSVHERSVRSAARPTSSTPGLPPSPSTHRESAEGMLPTVPETETLRITAEEETRPLDSASEDDPAAEGDAVATSRETSEAEVIQAWRGTELKINAIAYSRSRENRFAVVNLKTVHEGDQVEGLSVVEIEENGIVFEKAGTKYRLSLGNR